jgi:hypothetical protein
MQDTQETLEQIARLLRHSASTDEMVMLALKAAYQLGRTDQLLEAHQIIRGAA